MVGGIFSAYQQDDWADFLHTAEFAYNNHHHPSIGTTPFYNNYGYHPVYTDRASPEQVLTLPERLHQIHEVQARCQLAIKKAQKAYKRYITQTEAARTSVSQLGIASGWSPTTSARMPQPRNSLLDGWNRTRYLRRLEPHRTGWISSLPGGYTMYSMRGYYPALRKTRSQVSGQSRIQ